MLKTVGAAVGLVAAAFLAGCVPSTEAMQEEPAYVLASAEQAFEVRDYGTQMAAQHSAPGPYRRAGEQGYIRLERYFTGENTVPVPITMTMPVMAREEADGRWTTTFPLPDGYTPETAPPPVDQRIRVVEMPPRRVAAVSFRGPVGEAVLREQAARLADWLAAQGLAHRSDFTLASYDAPWKPAGWRTNEVLVTLH